MEGKCKKTEIGASMGVMGQDQAFEKHTGLCLQRQDKAWYWSRIQVNRNWHTLASVPVLCKVGQQVVAGRSKPI